MEQDAFVSRAAVQDRPKRKTSVPFLHKKYKTNGCYEKEIVEQSPSEDARRPCAEHAWGWGKSLGEEE